MTGCEQFQALISPHLDGELTPEEARGLEAHLAQCPACRALEARLSALHAAFAGLEELPAPEGFAQGVMGRIQAQEGQKTKVVPLFRRPQVRALAGLAACAVLCVGLYQAGLFSRAGNLDGDASAGGYADARSAVDPAEDGPEKNAAPFALSPNGDEEAVDTVPNAALYDSANALVQPEADIALTLAALPEGAGEVIPPETACSPAAQGGTLYYLSPQQLEVLEQLAQEQGIRAVPAREAEGGTELLCVLVLEP